ncbi:hypothetical protein F0562_023520 [Nyssa sinensis]|uniref:Uncharacterized protein n=1 Tax=Nyssa sinensis TaxID=561372 RepID=A0A5J5BI26_9ASTE|nr:hypothetical protein F0562_023520 [Nyssa sinensis]
MEAIKLTTTSFLQRLFSSAPAPVPGVTKPIPLISFFRYRPRIKGGRSRAAQPTASTSTRSFFPSRPRNRGGRSRAAQPTTSTSTCSFFPSRPRNRGGRSRTPAPTASINNCNWCCSTLCSTEPGLASTSYRILLFICSCNCCPIPPNTSNPFVAKYIASKLPDPARVLEHAGVLFGVLWNRSMIQVNLWKIISYVRHLRTRSCYH